MTFSTGVDMTSFFDDWLFLGGYPHFEIEKYTVNKKGEGYKIELFVLQKLVGRKVFCKNVPLQITFLDNEWKKHQTVISVSGQNDSSVIDLPFEPMSIIVNEEHRLNQARYDMQLKLTKKQKGKLNVLNDELGFYGLNIKSITDSAWLHLEHHPVAPDSIHLPDNHTISGSHYWSVKGIVPDNLDLQAVLFLDDKLDKDLMRSYGADSVVLLYRASENDQWQGHPNYIKNQSTSLTGFTFSVLKGDYAFANAQVQPHIFKAQKGPEFNKFECSIIDASVHLKVATANAQKICTELYNTKGKCLLQKPIKASIKEKTFVLSLKGFNSGIYFLKLRNSNGKIIRAEKLVL
jgi:hypothetical protein